MSFRSMTPFLAAACIGGCTQDFEQYVPTGDASSADVAVNDARPDVRDAAASDSACTPLQSCVLTAGGCNDQCRTQRNACNAGCPPPDGGFDACRDACAKTREICRTGCETACNTCMTNSGCPAPAQCNAAVN